MPKFEGANTSVKIKESLDAELAEIAKKRMPVASKVKIRL